MRTYGGCPPETLPRCGSHLSLPRRASQAAECHHVSVLHVLIGRLSIQGRVAMGPARLTLAAACIFAAPQLSWSQAPTVLLEACNALPDANKRLECLKAAVGTGSTTTPRPVPQAAAPTLALPLASGVAAPNSPSARQAQPSSTSGSPTCFVGPRGGTYTITKSGRKNYSGC